MSYKEGDIIEFKGVCYYIIEHEIRNGIDCFTCCENPDMTGRFINVILGPLGWSYAQIKRS